MTFTQAIDTARESAKSIADNLEIGYSSLYAYTSGVLPVPDDVARRLATYLRKRARSLTTAADKLEAAVKGANK